MVFVTGAGIECPYVRADSMQAVCNAMKPALQEWLPHEATTDYYSGPQSLSRLRNIGWKFSASSTPPEMEALKPCELLSVLASPNLEGGLSFL